MAASVASNSPRMWFSMHWSMKTRIVVTLAFTSANLKRVFWNSAMDLPQARRSVV